MKPIFSLALTLSYGSVLYWSIFQAWDNAVSLSKRKKKNTPICILIHVRETVQLLLNYQSSKIWSHFVPGLSPIECKSLRAKDTKPMPASLLWHQRWFTWTWDVFLNKYFFLNKIIRVQEDLKGFLSLAHIHMGLLTVYILFQGLAASQQLLHIQLVIFAHYRALFLKRKEKKNTTTHTKVSLVFFFYKPCIIWHTIFPIRLGTICQYTDILNRTKLTT